MKKKFETSFSLVSLITLGAAFSALSMFSACNHTTSTSTSNALPITGIGTATPLPTACPAWGCGNPPIVIIGTYTPTPTPTPTVHPIPIATPIGPEPIICPAWGCNYNPGGPVIISNSNNGETKDVDLQRAEMQDQTMNDRATAIANQFNMNFESAHQLALLADHVQTLTAHGAVSADDEQGVIQAAIGIAGLSQGEVISAIAQNLQGDDRATNALMEKAAQNLGMSSTATLRDQLLPALGISN